MGIFDVLKTAATIAKESGKLELQGEILGVYEKLLEQQKKISDLEIENKELKEKFGIKEKLIPDGNVYWIVRGENKDGPFCTRCWDAEKNLIRLHEDFAKRFYCPNCNKIARNEPVHIFKPIDHKRNGR